MDSDWDASPIAVRRPKPLPVPHRSPAVTATAATVTPAATTAATGAALRPPPQLSQQLQSSFDREDDVAEAPAAAAAADDSDTVADELSNDTADEADAVLSMLGAPIAAAAVPALGERRFSGPGARARAPLLAPVPAKSQPQPQPQPQPSRPQPADVGDSGELLHDSDLDIPSSPDVDTLHRELMTASARPAGGLGARPAALLPSRLPAAGVRGGAFMSGDSGAVPGAAPPAASSTAARLAQHSSFDDIDDFDNDFDL